MEVKRSEAETLTEELGMSGAKKWSDDKLVSRLKKLSELVDDDTELSKGSKNLYDAIQTSLEEEQDITIAAEKAAKPTKPAKEEKPAKGAKKKDEKPAKGKATKEKKEKAPKKPGVIATMIECLRAANSKKPTTKDAILKILVKKFPDREERAMKSTLNSQIPSGLKAEKNLIVKSNDKGYWLDA